MTDKLVIIDGKLELGSILSAKLYDYSGNLIPIKSVNWYGTSKLPADPSTWLSSLFVDDHLLSSTSTLYITRQSYQFIKCIANGIPSQLIIIDPSLLNTTENKIDSLDILGKGIDLRIPIEELSRSANIATDINRINQSLYLILTTAKGEVPMLPNLGSDLASSLFSIILPDDIPSIQLSIQTDLENQEPRIKINNIEVSFDDTTYVLRVEISYTIIGTNIGSNFIYNKQLGGGEVA